MTDQLTRLLAPLLAITKEAFQERPGDFYLQGFPRVIQWDGHSCGARCAMAVLRYYGARLQYDTVLARLGTSEDGTTEPQLTRFLRGEGFTVRSVTGGLKAAVERAIDRGAPLIVGVDRRNPHWLVVYGHGPGRVYVADPSIFGGPAAVHSWSSLKRRWDGSALVVEYPSNGRRTSARRRGRVVEIV